MYTVINLASVVNLELSHKLVSVMSLASVVNLALVIIEPRLERQHRPSHETGLSYQFDVSQDPSLSYRSALSYQSTFINQHGCCNTTEKKRNLIENEMFY